MISSTTKKKKEKKKVCDYDSKREKVSEVISNSSLALVNGKNEISVREEANPKI